MIVDAGPIIHRGRAPPSTLFWESVAQEDYADPCIGYILREASAPFRKLVILGDTNDPSAITPLVLSLPGPPSSLLIHEATDAYIPPHVDYKANRTVETVMEKCLERAHSTPVSLPGRRRGSRTEQKRTGHGRCIRQGDRRGAARAEPHRLAVRLSFPTRRTVAHAPPASPRRCIRPPRVRTSARASCKSSRTRRPRRGARGGPRSPRRTFYASRSRCRVRPRRSCRNPARSTAEAGAAGAHMACRRARLPPRRRTSQEGSGAGRIDRGGVVHAAGVEAVEEARIVWIRLYEVGALSHVACETSAH
jgi:hypothetical protein